MKENLHFLGRFLTPEMVTEDSLGNTLTYEDYQDGLDKLSGFTDEEDLVEKNRCEAMAKAVEMELRRVRNLMLGPVYSKSGKAWEPTEYWETAIGEKIPFKELEDDHLCRIPRFLYNNEIVSHRDDLPPGIVEEVERRGFSIDPDCRVVKFRKGF